MSTARPFALSILVLLLTAASAHADLKPIGQSSKWFKYVSIANDVSNVKQVKAGDKTYRLVTMDTPLNGDVASTSILLVGDEVGSDAGYDAGFVLSPRPMKDGSNELNVVTDISPRANGVELKAYTPYGDAASRTVVYDAKAGVLKESKLVVNKSCAGNDQAAIYACTISNLGNEDRALNSVYAKVLKGADSIRSAKIRAAQKAWISMRDASCELAGDDLRGGLNGEKALIAGCRLEMTKKRISELNQIANHQ